jgi:hypothetical protein
MKFSAGQLFMPTRGIYSCFEVVTHLRAVVDIDTDALIAEFLKSDMSPAPYDPDEHWGNAERLVPWMLRQGFVIEVEVPEWHFAEHSTLGVAL